MPRKYNYTKKTGRPPKYRKEFCEVVEKIMGEGLSIVCVAAELGVNQDTIHAWGHEHLEFSDSLNKGRTLCQEFWEKAGRAGMLGKIKNFNNAVWIFNMKNRFRWRDQVELSVAQDQKPIMLKYALDNPTKVIEATEEQRLIENENSGQ